MVENIVKMALDRFLMERQKIATVLMKIAPLIAKANGVLGIYVQIDVGKHKYQNVLIM